MPSHLGLKRRYSHFNRRYFNSELPSISVIWSPCNDSHGLVTFEDGKPVKLELDTTLQDTTRVTDIVMLHEMCHIRLCTTSHGAQFKAEIRRLWDLGAYDRLL